MKPEQKSLRVGAAVIALACILRFFGGGAINDITALMTDPTVSSILLYAGTGRVYPMKSQEAEPETETEPEPEPFLQTAVPAELSQEDAVLVSVTNHPGYGVDIPAMLEQPLQWDLTGEDPTVLIFHSHTCESYENTEGYEPSAEYRTTDQRYNMISIGQHLAQCLEGRGIRVLHDTTLHDYPSYTAAYDLSRETVQGYLEQYPSIRLVLDIHRDAYEDAGGNQLSNVVQINGQQSSRLMLVAGTDGYGEGHANWQDNLSVAVKLQAVLEKLYPGLCRDLSIRSSAFNQDLSSGALLIEVGTAGDTRQQALTAATFLADGIAQLAHGTS